MTYYVQRPVAGVGDHGALIPNDEIDADYAANLVAGGFLEELQDDAEVPGDAFVPEPQPEPLKLPADDAPVGEWRALAEGMLHEVPPDPSGDE